MDTKSITRAKEVAQGILPKYISYKRGGPIRGFTVTLEPDWKCNARCSFCNRWKKTNLNVLSKNEIFKVIDDIKDAGGKSIVLGGGEPLLRKDIFEIIRHAKSKGISVAMNTNGLLLPKLADGLSETKIDSIIVSIDSPRADIHDSLRGVKGIFDKALEGSKRLIGNGIKVTIGGVLVKDTLNDMKGLIELAAEIRAGLRFQPVHDELLNDLFLTNVDLGFSDYTYEDIEEKINEMIAFYEFRFGRMHWVDKVYYNLTPIFLKHPQELLSIKCTVAARNRYFVGPQGNVFPCESRRDINLGNVRNQSFKEIISSKQANNFRKEVLSDRKCVCWWRCEALDMIIDQFVPIPPIRVVASRKWRGTIRKL